MSPDRSRALAWLSDIGVICALGSGSDALRSALAPTRPAPLSLNTPFWPSPLPQGLVTEVLPSLDEFALRFQTRCNALLLASYRQIEASVGEAIRRHGAGRVAVVLGTSTAGIGEAQKAFTRRTTQNDLPMDFCLAQQGLGGPAEFLAQISGARGPCYGISTACTSASKAMASGARLLRSGLVDAVVAGGVDALNRFTLAGFDSLECVSKQPCNPMSANRNGINMGEGAALFLMSREETGIALTGWGESSDAHHFSAPDPRGQGATMAMCEALARARLQPGEIDYINLHGTATPQNDAMESLAVAGVFGTDIPCSSTKPLTGHTLGAAGAIEAAICWQALRDHESRALPPHWWDGQSDPALPALSLVTAGMPSSVPLRRILSNSFAFGGSNAALILERFDVR
ncbi:MAG: beta-ketoacyl-ACP synthase [Pseudomonadota bacterium]